jgi:hypothetical protein
VIVDVSLRDREVPWMLAETTELGDLQVFS